MESPAIEYHHWGGVRVRGREASDGLPRNGRLTTTKGDEGRREGSVGGRETQ